MPNLEVVVCPFYIRHNKGKNKWQYTITCERIQNNMGFQMRNMIRFCQMEEQDSWMELFCSSAKGYKDCPYYQAIYAKYEEDPDLEPEYDQYDEYEELESRAENEEMRQISIFEYMEEKKIEDTGKAAKNGKTEKQGIITRNREVDQDQ